MDEKKRKKGYSHPHGGHRNRMKERFRKSSLDGFQEHEILELLLFYSIPQKNTNELAHTLISHFGGLRQVFSADFEALLAVKGISEHSATLIQLAWALGDWRDNALFARDISASDTNAVTTLLHDWFAKKETEHIVVLFLDGQGRKLGNLFVLANGSLETTRLSRRDLVTEMTKRGADSFILAHNHPNGNLKPSYADIDVTKQLYMTFGNLERPLREHYIITDDGELPLVAYLQDQLHLQ